MNKMLLKTAIAGITIFGLGVATGIVAQTPSDSPQRMEQKRADLSGAPGMEVITSLSEYKPSEGIELHHHHGIEALYVVQGGTIQRAGQAPMPFPGGVAGMNLRDVKHGGFKVVGDTSVKLFTVHIVDKGKPLYDASK